IFDEIKRSPFSHNSVNNEEEFWPRIMIPQESEINRETSTFWIPLHVDFGTFLRLVCFASPVCFPNYGSLKTFIRLPLFILVPPLMGNKTYIYIITTAKAKVLI
ncbi:24687_t:CDS:2, partial [Dentiscutata erythropus]